MLTAARRRRGDERGFALVLFSLLLVVLLTMAALAIDLGAVYNARRNDQNAADVAALGGAQEISTNDNALIAQVEALAHDTLDLPLGTLDFNSCAGDPGALDDIVTTSAGSQRNCITRTGRLVRVQLPTQRYNAFFGNIAGQSAYEHDAFAIAGLTRQGFGGVLPFSLFTADAGHVCLRSDNNSSPVSPCNGTGTGDSGLLDFSQWGDPLLGTSEECQGQGSGPDGRLANNVAVGVDHDLELRPSSNSVIYEDHVLCGDRQAYPGHDPNGTQTNRGAGASQGLATGLFSGTGFSDGDPARLQRSSSLSYADRDTVEGINVDSTGLWEFIADAASTTQIPDQCERSQFEAVLAAGLTVPDIPNMSLAVENRLSTFRINTSTGQQPNRELRMEKMLERCFELYLDGTWDDNGGISTAETRSGCTASTPNPCTGVLFGRNSTVEQPEIYDIQLTPRFAYVPLVWEPGPSPNFVTFQRFIPIYLQRLCIGNQACSQGTFSPGVNFIDGNTSSTSTNVSAVSGFAFSPSMLPGGLGGPNAPFDINVNLFIRLVR